MKKCSLILLAFLLLNGLKGNAQISSEKEFIQFATSSPSEKLNKLIEGKWTTLKEKQWAEDGKQFFEYKYIKKLNEKTYIISLLSVKDLNTMEQKYSTKVNYTDIAIYNTWVANLKKQGYTFKEYEKGKFAATEEDYTIYYEKSALNSGTMYEFEVISY